MHIRGIAAICGLSLASGSVLASDYTGEIGVFYSDIDAGGFSDSALGIGGEFHFQKVMTAQLPLAEAGFMRRSSNVFGAYSTTDESDVDILTAGLELFQADLYLSGTVTSTDFGPQDSTDFGVRLGFFPADAWLLTVGYDNFDLADVSALSVGTKYVTPLAGETALNLEGELSLLDDDEDTMVLDAQADYYFNREFSAGLRIEETDAEGVDTAIGIGTRMFFTPLISGFLEYTTRDELDVFTIGGALRF